MTNLVLALVQQLNILVMDVKDAFLTVPQRDLVIVEVPTWARSVALARTLRGHSEST